jgi:endonuclease G
MAIATDRPEALEQQQAARERVAARTQERERNVELLAQPGGVTAVNPPELVVRRLDRLSRYFAGRALPSTPDELPQAPLEEVAAAALERAARAELPGAADAAAQPSVEAAGRVLEAIVGRADFLDVRYLDAGVAAARAVGRIHVRDDRGEAGFGTGSLVSPRLLLTNHHVLSDARSAGMSQVEFDYQLGLDGQPLQPRLFRLDPERFFVADRERDFALVAVDASETVLGDFGVNRFVQADGKAALGDFVTIVQHPQARMKEVVLRENEVVDQLDLHLHYVADTEPGSSGSPVFNDQWEVVALHHASAPGSTPGSVVNEGIRVSVIAAFVRAQRYAPAQQALVDQLGAFERIVVTTKASLNGGPPAPPAASTDGAVTLTVPLELTIGVRGAVVGGSEGNGAGPAASVPGAPTVLTEAVSIDPDYANRAGYDPAFLGMPVPLPLLSDAQRATAAVNALAGAGADPHELPYHHFSVVLDRDRRLARFTAVNVDGATSARIRREPDRWSLDPRVPAGEQTGEPVYRSNALDRGHLVRRLDPAWGPDAATAKRANDDTFHFTNCTPQHEDFNQNQTTWAGLEDYILENAENRDLRVNVFTGPVLAADDDAYRGVLLPRQFWKVVTMVKASGQLSATAYLLSQEKLLHDGGFEALPAPAPEEFSYGEYRTFQVPVAQVQQLTGLGFGALAAADPLAGLESTAAAAARPVDDVEQLVL